MPVVFEFLIPALTALLSGLWGAYTARKSRSEATVESPDQEIERLLRRLSSLVEESSSLAAGLTSAIEAREIAVQRLKAEADTAEALAELTQKQRAAVAAVLRGEITDENSRAFRLNVLTGALFFIAGSAVTVLVTMFVHPYS